MTVTIESEPTRKQAFTLWPPGNAGQTTVAGAGLARTRAMAPGQSPE